MVIQQRILVQSDWSKVYSEGNDKFWIAYKRFGQQTTHSYVSCDKNVSGQILISADNPAFTVDYHSSSLLQLSYIDEETSIRTRFKSPSKEFLLHGKNKKVNCLDVTNGGLGLSAAESCNTIKIWETASGTVRRELSGHAGDVYKAKFFPSGVVVLSGGADTQLKIWSAETGLCAATMVGHKAGVTDFDFVERGRNLVSCSRDGSAKLWDVGQQACIHTYTADDGMGIVNSCALRSTQAIDYATRADEAPSSQCDVSAEVGTEGKLLLLALETGKVRGFGLSTKKQLFEVMPPDAGNAVNCVAFTAGDRFAFGTESGAVFIYDLRNLSCPLNTWSRGHSAIKCIRDYRQGFLYSSGDGSVVCIDETLAEGCELSGADCDPVYQVTSTSQEIYTSCRDGYIRVYTSTDSS